MAPDLGGLKTRKLPLDQLPFSLAFTMKSVHNEDKDAYATRGALIVVEGLDRSGKSTQCATLVQALQARSHKVKAMRFPDRTTATGKVIDSFLRSDSHQDDHAIHLLFSANRWEAAEQIREDIANGITLVIDRYSYSGVVYSASKNKENLPLDWAWQPEIGLPRPDIWFFLNISQEEAAKRGGYGLERYENASLQSRVGKLYKSLMGLENNEEMTVIDAARPADEVASDMLEQTLGCISEVGHAQPLRKLGPLRFPTN